MSELTKLSQFLLFALTISFSTFAASVVELPNSTYLPVAVLGK